MCSLLVSPYDCADMELPHCPNIGPDISFSFDHQITNIFLELKNLFMLETLSLQGVDLRLLIKHW